MVLLPAGQRHTIRDKPGSPIEALDFVLLDHPVDQNLRMRYGGSGAQSQLLCGGFGLEALPQAMAGRLPPIIKIGPDSGDAIGWTKPLLAMIEAEARFPSPGVKAVFAKLADVVLTQALRSFLVSGYSEDTVEVTALLDTAVGPAIEAVQVDPARQWTVDRLAAATGMSRSGFSDRFAKIVGQPPIQYVATVRLNRAASYLTTTQKSLFEIAALTGYGSDAALAKAFKRSFGLTPGEFRSLTDSGPLLRAAPREA